MFAVTMLRRDVLRLYKQMLRTGRTWAAQSPEKTQEEQFYIISETKELFRKNKSVTDEETIKECLREAQSRLDLALHYGNPYPRPVNVAATALSPCQARNLKSQQKLWKQSRPVYIRSIDIETQQSPPAEKKTTKKKP
ncbi:unnamed protein product [Ixodes hexagonus]